MSEEKKDFTENKLTDEQVEQVSGGRSEFRGGVDDLIEDETGNQKSQGPSKTRGKLRHGLF